MEILSPAKINLFLHVTGKRPDGYHELITLMCCVGLYDSVTIDPGLKEISITCSDPKVPEDETNLAFKAASLFFKTLNKPEGVKISIKKNIPVGAGLGGGSSNAASVLSALNRYYDFPFSQDELISMGLSIGADVPFFIYRKPAIATGIGENLKAYERISKFHVLLVYPGFSVSTAEVYNNLNLGLTKCPKKLNYRSFIEQDFDIECHLCNDLETVAESRYPDIPAAKKALLSHGARGALMSGSGPTVFGLFSAADKAQRANQSLSQNDKWQIFLVDMLV